VQDSAALIDESAAAPERSAAAANALVGMVANSIPIKTATIIRAGGFICGKSRCGRRHFASRLPATKVSPRQRVLSIALPH
jgi:hypothetical protein